MHRAFFLAAILLAGGAQAAEELPPAKLQLALIEGFQWVGQERSVTALRLSLLSGANRDVSGVDLAGVVARTYGSQRGLQLSLGSEVDGDLTGLQLGVFASYVGRELRGVQLGGLVTFAERGVGLQLGLINRAQDLKGLQLGLVNFNDNGFLRVFPLFNYGR